MSTFLKLLLLELDSLSPDDFYEPDAEPRPSDQQAGELTEGLLRLYTLWQQTEKLAAEKAMEARFSRGPDDQRRELIAKARELEDKSGFVKDLFWLEVRDENHLWDKPVVGVRKGRRVIWSDEPPRIVGFGPFPLT